MSDQSKAPDQPEIITIGVVGSHSAEVKYRIRRTTKMGKVLDNYFNRIGVQPATDEDYPRVYVNDRRVCKDDTAQDLELKEGDVLEFFAPQRYASVPTNTTEHIVIKLVDVDHSNTEIRFKLRPTTKIGKVKKAFCERIGLPQCDLRFVFDGKLIKDEDTPLSLNMIQGSVIEVFKPLSGSSPDSISFKSVWPNSYESSLHTAHPTTKMSEVKKAICGGAGIPQHRLRFLLNGQRIGDDDTPLDLQMTPDDSIEVFLEQEGGCI